MSAVVDPRISIVSSGLYTNVFVTWEGVFKGDDAGTFRQRDFLRTGPGPRGCHSGAELSGKSARRARAPGRMFERGHPRTMSRSRQRSSEDVRDQARPQFLVELRGVVAERAPSMDPRRVHSLWFDAMMYASRAGRCVSHRSLRGIHEPRRSPQSRG